MIYSLVSGPESEPITLDQVKKHSRIDGTDEDDYLPLLISAARRYAENYCELVWGCQTLQLTNSWFPDRLKGPAVSIDWIKYYSGGELITWGPENYRLDGSLPSRIVPVKCFPAVDCRPDAVQIQYSAGKDPTANLKLALLIMVSHWYENREPIVVGTIVAQVPWSANALLDMECWGNYT